MLLWKWLKYIELRYMWFGWKVEALHWGIHGKPLYDDDITNKCCVLYEICWECVLDLHDGCWYEFIAKIVKWMYGHCLFLGRKLWYINGYILTDKQTHNFVIVICHKPFYPDSIYELFNIKTCFQSIKHYYTCMQSKRISNSSLVNDLKRK